jgi:hypothetical protein
MPKEVMCCKKSGSIESFPTSAFHRLPEMSGNLLSTYALGLLLVVAVVRVARDCMTDASNTCSIIIPWFYGVRGLRQAVC